MQNNTAREGTRSTFLTRIGGRVVARVGSGSLWHGRSVRPRRVAILLVVLLTSPSASAWWASRGALEHDTLSASTDWMAGPPDPIQDYSALYLNAFPAEAMTTVNLNYGVLRNPFGLTFEANGGLEAPGGLGAWCEDFLLSIHDIGDFLLASAAEYFGFPVSNYHGKACFGATITAPSGSMYPFPIPAGTDFCMGPVEPW